MLGQKKTARSNGGLQGKRWLQHHIFSIKTLSLVVLAVQTSTMVLLLRYSRTSASGNHQQYIITTAVLLSEILKLTLSLGFLHIETGKMAKVTFDRLYRDVVLNVWETLKLAIPAFLYVVQNNLLFIALSNLDAATYQVESSSWNENNSSLKASEVKGPLGDLDHPVEGLDESEDAPLPDVNEAHPNTEVSWLLGIFAVFVSCISSGFSGVYFERLVKKGTQPSLVIRNIQLGVFSIVFAVIAVSSDWSSIKEGGFFQGYTLTTWGVVLIQAFGGLIVSVTMKYADNILKGFATSLSIVMCTLVSWLVFGDAAPSTQFIIGTTIVISSTVLYGFAPQATVTSQMRGSQFSSTDSPHKVELRKRSVSDVV
ncbi:UDP-N-acetylglucosamine transporter-like isoform X3 [Palaemon carinicauda]|uniref:UDP-N-acetylglucosamine transporter-like isoform X3 n=1 Tax=Palaemon carinicauda TaxID=392227 RepID=UPI0035B5AF42